MADELSSNLTGFFIAEEASPGVLPATPVWYEREPNSYADFGGNMVMTTRQPITSDRMTGKGEVSDNDPTAGWNEDLTPNNMTWLMQGFVFADSRKKPSTVATDAAAIDDGLTVASSAGFVAGSLVLVDGFANAANNGMFPLTAVAAGELTVDGALVDEAGVVGATVAVVGHEFPTSDLSLTVTADKVVLTSAAMDFTTFGLTPGEWIAVGGDAANSRFAEPAVPVVANQPFYARIAVDGIAEDSLTFDKTTGLQETTDGTGKTLQLFFGTFLQNERTCGLQKQRTYTMERQYGCGTGSIEAEYVSKASPNQLTLTIPTPGADAKLTVDLTFIGSSSTERDGTEGVLGGTRVLALNEPCFKPGLDVYQSKIAVIDEDTMNPTPLVAYISDGSIVINNNVAGNKAVGVFGNSGFNVGNFGVSGSLNGYFTTVKAARAVRQGADMTYHVIATKANAAVVCDIPLVGMGNARATVDANTPIKIPLEMAGGRSKFGNAIMWTFMQYVPTVLMANR